MEHRSFVDIAQLVDYRLLFIHSPELYLVLKPDGAAYTILDASDAYLKATLTSRHDIIGKSLFEAFPDNPDQPLDNGVNNLRASLETACKTRQTHVMAIQKYDVPVHTSNGVVFEEKYWNPKNTPILSESQEVIYLLHQVEDVTRSVQHDLKSKVEREEAEEEIRKKSLLISENEDRINRILEALLRYTTMDFSVRLTITEKGDELDAIVVGLNSLIDELENSIRLLTDSNHALEYANKELDSFSYSVSHDLRAPLRGINGYSQVLLEDYSDKLDEEGISNIHVIMKNAVKMGALIDDLLTFSRIGKQNISKIQLNMLQIVEAVIYELKQSTRVNAVFSIRHLDNIEGDKSMMIQVMTNLISNAIKYSSKKEKPEIEIGSSIKNGSVVFYVTDNGAGFDMKYYDKLFGVFQRLHGATEFEGTGVGLALVQRIIKKHQGEIWAEASVGKGATFSFSIPIINTN